MRPFEYARPASLEEAVRLLSEGEGPAAALAGGTDLLSLLKDDLLEVRRLVSLGGIAELRGIHLGEDGARIGAMTTIEALLEHEALGRAYPALAQAAEGIRSPQIRAMGTVGGELLQRPRCWYFRNGYGLLALRDGRSMVRDGDNRYHAILGNDGAACFVHASSLAPALMVYGARVRIAGPGGPRETDVAGLYRIPRREGEDERALGRGEIVTEIVLPPARGLASATYEVRQKEALDWPLAAAAVAYRLRAGRVEGARIVLGHVAPVPWPAPEAARALEGKALDEPAAEAAARQAVQGAQPLSRNAYKVTLARVAVRRALLRAAGRGEGA